MVPQQIKIFILMYLLLINSSFSGANNSKSIIGMELTNYTPNNQDEVMMMKGINRKLLMKVDAMLDYQDPGANPIHDPRKGH
uniref:Uncharacterized protein n=1 Tax=Cannabis sativa TaxID=3483 RepID=A0A803R6M9_CANSA